MFTFDPIIVATVDRYRSAEVHLLERDTDRTYVVMSFTPWDAQGNRVLQAPVAVVTMKGEAYNAWYSQWNSEANLYTAVLNLYQQKVTGLEITGVDMSKLATSGLAVDANTPEVLAVVPG